MSLKKFSELFGDLDSINSTNNKIEVLKNFLKKVAKKSVLLYFWSRSVDLYDFRVDTLWYKLGL